MKFGEKQIEFEGVKYKIDVLTRSFYSKILVNGEESSIMPKNVELNSLSGYKSAVTTAIKEYIVKKKTEKTFKEWDGKL